MTNSDYFQRDTDVARVNTDEKPGQHPPHGDDYFRRDCEVVRVNRDGNDPTHDNDDYFRRDDQVARVNEGDDSDDASDKTLRDAIRENALGPKKVAGDAGSVEQHSLKDQIEAERFLASKEATKRPGLGIRLTKLVPDGTT
ncbi:MAG: hypothetical protein FWH27_19510 [Planctomycetaceae bacterium]|nr:hypothetical protein [Planctomycetaceae bacterium]